MSWCNKEACHYGSAVCKMNTCPQCGSKNITNKEPYGKDGKRKERPRDDESQAFPYAVK